MASRKAEGRFTQYRGVEIEHTLGGWWVAFVPDHGYLKADSLEGVRELIRGALQGKGVREAPRRAAPPRSPEPKREAEAGFAIGIHDQGVIEDNARDSAGQWGDPEWAKEMVHLGVMTKDGEITSKGWDLLNRDIGRLERNALSWMKATFNHVRDDGHSGTDEIVGSFWFDPTNYDQAWLVELATPEGRGERIDMTDSSYGDLPNTVFNEVSNFGAAVLGGQIVFFDVKPEDMEAIEDTVQQHERPQRRGVSEARRHPEYGINRDYPKIDIYVDGNYVATTTWARTLREAVAQYVAKNRDVDARKVTASFQIAKKRRTQRRP